MGRSGGLRMNHVVLTGRLTRDPELRKLASGKTVTHVLREYQLMF